MLRCKELSRLPKAASGKYVNFRRQTPGCTADHFAHAVTPLSNYLDASHPVINVPRSRLPSVRSDILGVKAVPFALLSKPEQIWTTPSNPPIETWSERIRRLLNTNANLDPGEEPLEVAPILLNNVKENAVPMSFINATSKKRTSNKKYIRVKIASRLKVAINLIVTRGANVEQVNGKPKLVMNEKEAEGMSDKWVSPGWTYIFFPTLEIYRMPYHEMIPLLRNSLQQIYIISQTFEKQWASSAMNPRNTPPAQPPYYTRPHAQAPDRHAFAKTTTPRKPPQQRTSRQSASREYSTRTTSTESSPGPIPSRTHQTGKSKIFRDWYNGPGPLEPQLRSRHSSKLNKMPTLVSGKEPTKIEEGRVASQTDGPSPSIRLGEVVFKGTRNIPSRSMRRNDNSPKIPHTVKEDDPRIQFLKEVRKDVTQVLGRSELLYSWKMRRKSLRRQAAPKVAKRSESLGPEFVGFDARPNPSYDPFTDVDDFKAEEGLTTPTRQALLDLLDKSSARMSPRNPGWHALAEEASSSFSDHSSKYPHVDPPKPDDFDPFAPLIAQSPVSEVHTKSTNKSPDRSSDPLDFDNFASLESEVAPRAPEPKSKDEIRLPTDSSRGRFRSIEDLIQAFDPFHPGNSTTTPVSTASELGSMPSASTRGNARLEGTRR